MEEWDRMMAGNTFITDLGEEHTVTVENVEQTLGRYAVWSPLKGQTGHTIVEVGSDLADLMGRYSVPPERVCAICAAGR